MSSRREMDFFKSACQVKEFKMPASRTVPSRCFRTGFMHAAHLVTSCASWFFCSVAVQVSDTGIQFLCIIFSHSSPSIRVHPVRSPAVTCKSPLNKKEKFMSSICISWGAGVHVSTVCNIIQMWSGTDYAR